MVIERLYPPDDTGASTLLRFRYQAEVAFPFCLECALRGEPRSVIGEHFNDFVLEYPDGWRFLQVKTRDLERGPWRLCDLLVPRGALGNLYRTFSLLRGRADFRLDLLLEGGLKRGDLIETLAPAQQPPAEALTRISEVLDATEPADVAVFLSRLRVVGSRILRESIKLHNLKLLNDRIPGLSSNEAELIYEAVVSRLLTAMMGQGSNEAWQHFCNTLSPAPADMVYHAKRLTREHLRELFHLPPLRPGPQSAEHAWWQPLWKRS